MGWGEVRYNYEDRGTVEINCNRTDSVKFRIKALLLLLLLLLLLYKTATGYIRSIFIYRPNIFLIL